MFLAIACDSMASSVTCGPVFCLLGRVNALDP